MVNSVNAFKEPSTSLGFSQSYFTQLIYKVEFVGILLIMTYLLYRIPTALIQGAYTALNTKSLSSL